MTKYPKYKTSTVEWIGEIPEYWETRRLKYIVEYNKDVLSETIDGDFQIEYVEISDVEFGRGITNTTSLRFKDAPSRARRKVKEGDVIVSTVRTYLKAITRINELHRNVIVSTGFVVINPTNLDSHYCGHLFNCEHLIGEIISRSTGVSYPAITSTDLVDISVPLPPLPEQQVIATYLDKKTKLIDETIAKKQRLIELLQEERTAMINQAVTRGLNPNVKLRPSGIEWLGDIPEHWELKRIKFVGDSIIGITYSPEDVTTAKNGILVLRSSNIQKGKLSLGDNVYVKKDIQDRHITKEGDILICSRNGSADLIGKNILIDNFSSGQTFGAFMTVFRTNQWKFMYWFFNSSVFKGQTGLFSTSTINQLTNDILNNMEVAFPPTITEQEDIVKYLDDRTMLIYNTIKKTEGEIELLVEYRTALINEVVTGKVCIL